MHVLRIIATRRTRQTGDAFTNAATRSLSSGRVALLGIADRSINVSRGHILPNRKPRKSFPTIVKTLGDHLQVKRAEKGFSLAELAGKARVTKSTILRWEVDAEVPNDSQWQLLERVLNLDSIFRSTKPDT